MIDTEAAIADGTLENNIYMMDGERMEGSEGCGTGMLTTCVCNGILADGSQTEDVVLNWCVDCIQTQPATLPRFYDTYIREKRRKEAIDNILHSNSVSGNDIERLEKQEPDPYPYIADITGEAVDSGVMFPAQYGTPVPVHGGWYWSASVSTYRPGVYRYVLHIELYRNDGNGLKVLEMTHEAAVRIVNAPQRNGFTGAGVGFLPVSPAVKCQSKEGGTP